MEGKLIERVNLSTEEYLLYLELRVRVVHLLATRRDHSRAYDLVDVDAVEQLQDILLKVSRLKSTRLEILLDKSSPI